MNIAEQVVARCRELAQVTDVGGQTTRTYLSAAMRQANDVVGGWMREAGLTVHVDAAGNLRGVREAASPEARTLILASHLDTVPDAGAFDGALGVVLGIAVAEELRDVSLPFRLEVIGFSEEEGVRFGAPFLGSLALVGGLDAAMLERRDSDGVSVCEAMRGYGLAEEDLPKAVVPHPLGYLEMHIEQGPVLDSEGLPLGVVEAIAGQSRYQVWFHGAANHAGTTPMDLRHDAMSAAAAWIVEVERYARETAALVATVGSVQTRPGAGNVIAGEVIASLDVRSQLDSLRTDAVQHLLAFAKECGSARGVTVDATLRMEQPAVAMDQGLMRLLEDAVDETGCLVRRMISGAGHDAMIMAAHMPAAMLFLRSPGGVSHHPAETVLVSDVALAWKAGVAFVRKLALREAGE